MFQQIMSSNFIKQTKHTFEDFFKDYESFSIEDLNNEIPLEDFFKLCVNDFN